MKNWKIPLFKIHWIQEDVKAVEKVIKRGAFWAAGPEIEEFEKKIADFTQRKYALTFNSGTSALHAMIEAIEVKDKEVIVPSFTFIATANAVVLAGGIPIFAEIEKETFGFDFEDVQKRITNKTKAILALNYAGGVSRDIEKLASLAKEKNIILLEDNSHSLGVRKNGKLCGTFGEAAALSFCQNKLITTGEGGAVITDSQKIYEKMKLIRSHGRVESEQGDYFSNTEDFDYTRVGYNYRLASLNAALGISQLDAFDTIIKKRVEIGTHLSKNLSNIKGLIPPTPYPNSDHFYQMYTIILEDEKTRDKLQVHLTDKGIMCRPYYTPIHLKTFYKKNYGCKKGDLPKTEQISKTILTLPIYPEMTKNEADYIINQINCFMESQND